MAESMSGVGKGPVGLDTQKPETLNPLQVLTALQSGPGRWGEGLGALARGLNVNTTFIQGGSEHFQEMRENLNTKPGIAIANHPTPFDSCFVFQALNRNDILLVLAAEWSAYASQIMGQKHILAAPHDEEAMEKGNQRVTEHISAGGLLVMFPSAYMEKSASQLRFKSGFRHFVSKIAPDNMVYAFNIDPDVAPTLRTHILGKAEPADKVIQVALGVSLRPMPQPTEIKVNESYSTAAEWQKIISDSTALPSDQQNELLAKHFLEKTAFPH